MLISITFKNFGYCLQIGHNAGFSSQIWKISLVKVYYSEHKVSFAEIIFCF